MEELLSRTRQIPNPAKPKKKCNVLHSAFHKDTKRDGQAQEAQEICADRIRALVLLKTPINFPPYHCVG